MTRASYRFADWGFQEDEQTWPVSSAECRSSESCKDSFKVCGADAKAVRDWMAAHATETGHTHFWEEYGRPTVVTPPEGSKAAQRVAERLAEYTVVT